MDRPQNMSAEEFNKIFGPGMWMRAMSVLNNLAPVSRRDDWWTTDGPLEIIAEAINDAKK